MKKSYVTLEMDIIRLMEVDVITASSQSQWYDEKDGDVGQDWYWGNLLS